MRIRVSFVRLLVLVACCAFVPTGSAWQLTRTLHEELEGNRSDSSESLTTWTLRRS
jgi:hypothetical protein